ncbi:hypothetical protein K1719_001565 [Acacia pycnantha]|nr:hypothetical protein K1719_001565 [Acacia pycnantha]
MEWIKDLQFLLDDASYVFGDHFECKVHRGFYSVYTATNSSSQSNIAKTSARTQVLTEIRRLVNKYKDEEISITVTGHSLGAALATLNAVDWTQSQMDVTFEKRNLKKLVQCPVTAIVFASPRVGDSNFEEFSSSRKDLGYFESVTKILFRGIHFWVIKKMRIMFLTEAWRVDQNKGLVQQLDGTWKMEEPESDSEDDVF